MLRDSIVHYVGLLPSLSFKDSLLFILFCALSVHKIYNRYEVEPGNILASLFLLGVVPATSLPFVYRHTESLLTAVCLVYCLFYTVLTLSIVIYRVSPFHPLSNYPGPVTLKISKFAVLLHTYNGKQHIFFKGLHDKYGPYVRIGPNELSICDVAKIQSILGANGTRKGPQYDAHNEPGTPYNVVATRDTNAHHQRRKLWSHGLTSAIIKSYQPTIAERVLQLAEELRKLSSQGESVNLAGWISRFTYDFMGDLVFDGGLETMRDGDKLDIIATLEEAMFYVGILSHIPWITSFVWKFNLKSEKQVKVYDFAEKCLTERKMKGSSKKDLFHFITNEDGLEDIQVGPEQTLNDTLTAIIAGADTTSTVLAGVFYYLLTHPTTYERLRAEVDGVFPVGEGEPFDTVKLAEMPYLNAVINETLRLQPPVPTSLQRSPLKNSGGKWIAGSFVPESTAFYVPPYVLHRDPRYFSPSTEKFIPERWIDESKFTTNTEAFIPFSTGPANCAGKNLAILEMRMTLAALIQKFEMRLAAGYDPQMWEKELGDFFVIKVGKLPVVLTARE